MYLGLFRLPRNVTLFAFWVFAAVTITKNEKLEIVSGWASPAREVSEFWSLQDPTNLPGKPISVVYDGINDEDNWDCYRADSRNAWATFQLHRTSFVSNVTLRSTYSLAIQNVEVSVCSGSSMNCTFCGKTPDIETECPEFSVLCFDAIGDEVRLQKVNKDPDRSGGGLELCEVEIFGPGCDICCRDYHPICPALFDLEFYKIYVERVTSGENPQSHIPPVPDCANEFYSIGCPLSCGRCLNCYDKEKEMNGLIRKYSSQVHFLSEHIADVTNQVVKIDATRKDELKAVADSFKPKVQELTGQIDNIQEVFDYPAKSKQNGVYKLGINSAKSSDGDTNHNWLLRKSFDGLASTGVVDCYVSRKKNNSGVTFVIEEAVVKFVRILAAPDQTYTAANYEVWVCENYNCSLCGSLGTMEKDEFKSVDCGSEFLGSGYRGDTIKITFRGEMTQLNLCEMEVYGKW